MACYIYILRKDEWMEFLISTSTLAASFSIDQCSSSTPNKGKLNKKNLFEKNFYVKTNGTKRKEKKIGHIYLEDMLVETHTQHKKIK